MKILKAALDLKEKNITSVMKPLDECFMLDISQVLDRNMLGKIYKNGYSRIPIYDGDRQNIVGILMAKDLILLNPDRDNLSLE